MGQFLCFATCILVIRATILITITLSICICIIAVAIALVVITIVKTINNVRSDWVPCQAHVP